MRALLASAGMELVGEAGSGAEALAQTAALAPDVVMMDLHMPDVNGIEATRQIVGESPSIKVIALSMHEDPLFVREMLRAGASGYLLKDRPAEELADAVRRVHRGLRVIDPELATEAWGELDPLTDRERQVLRLAGEGKPSGDIAGELGLSEGTVRNYLSEAISKLGAANRVDAARIARGKGWL